MNKKRCKKDVIIEARLLMPSSQSQSNNELICKPKVMVIFLLEALVLWYESYHNHSFTINMHIIIFALWDWHLKRSASYAQNFDIPFSSKVICKKLIFNLKVLRCLLISLNQTLCFRLTRWKIAFFVFPWSCATQLVGRSNCFCPWYQHLQRDTSFGLCLHLGL